MRGLSRLAVAVFTVTLNAVLSFDTAAKAVGDDIGPTASTQTTSSPADSRMSSMWFALYSYRRGPAHFVSSDERRRETLYVEATSPNLEVALAVKVARGLLSAETLNGLSAALHALERMNPTAIAAMRPLEPIEHDGLLVDAATCVNGKIASWFGLAAKAMPIQVSETLGKTAAAASKLGSHLPPSLVRVTPVEAHRAERIRSDPRAFYAIIPIQKGLVDSLPHLRAALRCPGSVVETDEREDGLVREWLRLSNPKGMGNTFFLQVESDAVRSIFQVHVPEVRRVP